MGEVWKAASAEAMGVRRLGLTAAGLLVIVTVALALVTNGRAKPNLVHTCSATDRQFIDDARTNMTALELWSEQYQSGDASAEDVVGQARAAAKIMRGTGPTDFSLRQTQRLVIGASSIRAGTPRPRTWSARRALPRRSCAVPARPTSRCGRPSAS